MMADDHYGKNSRFGMVSRAGLAWTIHKLRKHPRKSVTNGIIAPSIVIGISTVCRLHGASTNLLWRLWPNGLRRQQLRMYEYCGLGAAVRLAAAVAVPIATALSYLERRRARHQIPPPKERSLICRTVRSH